MFKGLRLLTPIVTTGAIIAIPTSNQMIFNESTRNVVSMRMMKMLFQFQEQLLQHLLLN